MTKTVGIQQGKIYEEFDVNEMDILEDQFESDNIQTRPITVKNFRCGVMFAVAGVELKLYFFYEGVSDFLEEHPEQATRIPVRISHLNAIRRQDNAVASNPDVCMVQLVDESGVLNQRQLERLTCLLVGYFGGNMPPTEQAEYFVLTEEPAREVRTRDSKRICKQPGGYRAALESVLLS